jgi:hypothetical protein
MRFVLNRCCAVGFFFFIFLNSLVLTAPKHFGQRDLEDQQCDVTHFRLMFVQYLHVLSSKANGMARCSTRWNFSKNILCAGQCTLKAVYFMNFKLIRCYVSYLIPSLIGNSYLLFQVSRGHNSVSVQKQTHLYMNNFDHKDLGSHRVHLCPQLI